MTIEEFKELIKEDINVYKELLKKDIKGIKGINYDNEVFDNIDRSIDTNLDGLFRLFELTYPFILDSIRKDKSNDDKLDQIIDLVQQGLNKLCAYPVSYPVVDPFSNPRPVDIWYNNQPMVTCETKNEPNTGTTEVHNVNYKTNYDKLTEEFDKINERGKQ